MYYKNGEIQENNDVQYNRNLIESILEPIFIVNIQGEIIDFNKATSLIIGKERENILYSNFEDYCHPVQQVRNLISIVCQKGSLYDQALELKDEAGNLIPILCNGTPFKDNEGNLIGVIFVVRETSKQKWSIELEEAHKEKEKQQDLNKELEKLNNSAILASQYTLSLIEASQDPLVTLNTKGKITDMNQALVNSTGMSREELTGSDFFDYFTEKKNAREVHKEVFDKGSVSNLPLTIKHRNGKLTDVLCNGSVYKDAQGEVAGVVIVARDVTEQKKIASALIEARVFAELATEIAEEAKKNAESAAIIAKNAVKAKQQFLSNMSHEIRTPMNAIIGFTKVVLKTDLTVKQLEYINAIKMSGDALIVLINDILDLAKVDSGKMTFEKKPFKLNASLESMLHLFENKIQEKNLKLIKEYDPNIPKVLVGDPVRLHQIILNLVNNAVKFTQKGIITVGAQLVFEDDDRVVIEFSISDTGIGIPEDKLNHIFENFNQASSGTSRIYGGTGLGLAIVKQLVELQGGKIRVKSTIKKGSNFSFSLSFQKTNANAALENDLLELDSEIKNIKVLVVEDIALNQLLMKTVLDDFGFERDVAENGKIAIEMLKDKAYDIILMDLQMPEMNGFEATEYIRIKMQSQIPIIALTADVTTVDLDKCKAVGMNDYLAKPVDERLLYSKIVGILKKPKLEKLSAKLNENIDTTVKKIRCIDLVYLNQRTKSNPELMMEMIDLYLAQTPTLINTIKQSFAEQNWQLLAAAAHKMIPSFSIMGISTDFEDIAKRIQEFANSQEKLNEIDELVLQLEEICLQACGELEEELNIIKNTKK
ncbi:hybrid sensor histidine kinase/response regulator [Flavobacterium sp. SOK18b]|uniref:PAS domain-containing hybrid sensor histidine kinase/response regulator n=1 Tax=Flavobacterium sp. SOK18b TaxID=797900 RepID=UPI0015F9EA23|nr:PAS domain-containing hybrid sensor histidine kinase/response regulator [Flavobacterium sp. SOK18b]MBB1195120.1 hybrid sensor histidine kinase/response regulator [Flavobacterium sp. SOK18b]